MADIYNLTFESGNLTGSADSFDSAVTNGGNLSVATAAALVGIYGLKSHLSDTDPQYGAVPIGGETPYHRARMLFDPNSLTCVGGPLVTTCAGYFASGVAVARWRLVYDSGFKIRIAARLDSGSDSASSDTSLTDAPHLMDLYFGRSSGVGANDGFLRLWIDESEVLSLTSLDNDTMQPDELRVGAPLGADANMTGDCYFDNIRVNYTGDEFQDTFISKLYSGVRFAGPRKSRGERALKRTW